MKTTRTTKMAAGMLSAAFLLWGTGGVAIAGQGSGRGLRSPAQIEAELEAQRELEREIEIQRELEIEHELEMEQELEQEIELEQEVQHPELHQGGRGH